MVLFRRRGSRLAVAAQDDPGAAVSAVTARHGVRRGDRGLRRRRGRDQDGTWITPEMRATPTARLAALGYAHSVEAWEGDELVGGLYGVALGRMFFGESMFARRSDASKVALVHLVRQLERWGFRLIDCQMSTAHLASLGAREIRRADFLRGRARLVARAAGAGALAARRRIWSTAEYHGTMESRHERAAVHAQESTLTEPRSEQKLQRPRLWRVLLHNDDYTTQDFVVWVLETIFHKPRGEAFAIMMSVHQSGLGVAGVYTHDVAETKLQGHRAAGRRARIPAAGDDGA